MDDKKQPIIIKRIKKGGHAHHGGSWKVAFADFATAMMAFFMVMWLLQVATPETLGGISEYFKNVTMIQGKSVVPSPGLQGPGGASTSPIDLGGGLNAVKEGATEGEDKKVVEIAREKIEIERDKKRLDSLMSELKKALEKSETLSKYKDQLLLDITPEGLRIQIIDKENRPMFLSGSATLKYYSEEILLELAGFINTVPNRISISGHTDSIPFIGAKGYSNWELSADRANSARRTLIEGGLDNNKLARVVGLASSVPFDKNSPESASNRRISIIVMNRETEQALTANNTHEELNELPSSKVDTADDTTDGIERQLNQAVITENPQPPTVEPQPLQILPIQPIQPIPGQPVAAPPPARTPPVKNNLSEALPNRRTLNPQNKESKATQKVAPAPAAPAAATKPRPAEPQARTDDLNDLLRDLQTLNPQSTAEEQQEESATGSASTAPAPTPQIQNDAIKLAPAIDPSLLPKAGVAKK
jgi:chemotaxis protein MotB